VRRLWRQQRTLVGSFIVLAVMFEQLKGARLTA